ncbi:MAG: CPBP family intramembrane glutamic endopeptidase [Hyphomicrobiaceae bacterium]|nr:CPBP family intramembrane glutamic endopeptidase [Hyphomicrobiaceae bacterium]
MHDVPPNGSVPSIPLTAAPSPPGEAGKWSVLGALGFALLVVGSAMVAGNVLNQAYLAWRLGVGAIVDLDGARQLAQAEQHLLFVAIQLVSQLVQLTVILWLVRLWHRDWVAALGLAWPQHGLGGWVQAILLLFVVKMAATLVAAGIAPSSPREELAPFVALVRTPLAWSLFLATVLLAGVTEELVFRGVLSRTLEATRLGFWGGATLTSAGFAALHMQYGIGGQIVIFAIGMTLAWIRSTSRSLWPAILCHALNNGIALFAMRSIG